MSINLGTIKIPITRLWGYLDFILLVSTNFISISIAVNKRILLNYYFLHMASFFILIKPNVLKLDRYGIMSSFQNS